MRRMDYRNEWLEHTVGLTLLVGGALLAGCNPAPIAEAPTGLAAQQRRSAFQSLCAQNAVECTSSWPTPSIDVEALGGQTVTASATGFVVESLHAKGAVWVQLIGSGSDAGTGANVLTYAWSAGASDADPCTLGAGTSFSTEADPQIELQPGFHYIRLTVMNEIIREVVPVLGCATTLENVASFDFLEVEIEVR